VHFSPDGGRLAVGSNDHSVVVWDLSSASVVDRLDGHAGPVLALAFSPDGGTLYSGGADNRVLVWDLTGRRRLVARIVDGGPRAGLAAAAIPSPPVDAVAYAGITGSGPETWFLDIASGRSSGVAVDRVDHPLVAWRSPDDQSVLVADHRDLRVWDCGTDRMTVHVVTDSDTTALASTADGTYSVVGDALGVVRRLDGGSLLPAGPPVRLDHPPTALAALPDGHVVAVSDDMTYAVIDLGAGTKVGGGDLGFAALAAAVSPDGSRLAVGGRRGEVGVFDLGTLDWLGPPRSIDREDVIGVSFAADGATFTTSSSDGTVRLWDGHTGDPIAGIRPGGGVPPAVAVDTTGGPDAIIATRDGAVYRLDTRFSSWQDFACAVAGRDLTTQEWTDVFGDRPYHATCPAG
jgi:WD40 repeat protein